MSLEKILRWIVIAGVFALPFVPLIVSTSLFFPYITGKNFAFRVVVELMAGFWLALALVDAKYRPKRGWILGCFAIFIFVIAVADAQGANPFKSFWSNYERMDGWVTIAHLFVYLVIASVVMDTEKLWRRLFQLSLLVSLYISVTGLLSVITGANGTNLQTRIDLSFGNPIYLAVYMLFQIFIAALLWQQMRVMAQKGKQLWMAIFYGIVIVLDTFALFFTGTRGTELGLIGGAILAILLYAFFQGSRRMRGIAALAVVVVIVLSGGLYAARNSGLVNQVGFLGRLASISLTDDTIHTRILNIEIAWKGIEERPILGWGQEDYAIVFDKYYDPRMYAQEPWFDRVHNIIFDWLVAGGVIGLAAYLSIFVATLWALWRKNRAGTQTFTLAERSILTGLLAGYFFHNLTVFDNITSYILFGTILAYIVWRRDTADKAAPIFNSAYMQRSILPVAAVLSIIAGFVLVWAVNWNAYQENVTLLSALESPDLSLFEKAISYGTYGTQEAREQLAQIAAEAAGASSQQVSDSVKQQFFTAAVTQMQLQEKQSPLDARFPLFIGTVDDSFGDYTDAATALEQAHELSPDKQAILFQIGLNDQALNNMTGAEQIFKQAYELDTADQEAFGYYVAAAVRADDDTTADQLLTPAVIAAGTAATQQLASAYAARNEYAKIIPIWTAYLAVNPTDTTAYTTLAAAYYETKNDAQAIATLQALAKESPASASQAEALIQEIQNGTVNVQ